MIKDNKLVILKFIKLKQSTAEGLLLLGWIIIAIPFFALVPFVWILVLIKRMVLWFFKTINNVSTKLIYELQGRCTNITMGYPYYGLPGEGTICGGELEEHINGHEYCKICGKKY